MRGLKQGIGENAPRNGSVAPYVGAWIETQDVTGFTWSATVAPYVGAWIETTYHDLLKN